MARCVHRKCGQAFTGLAAFDRHLKMLPSAPWVVCREPVSVGLVWSDARSAWGTGMGAVSAATIWGLPPHPDGAIVAPTPLFGGSEGAS